MNQEENNIADLLTEQVMYKILDRVYPIGSTYIDHSDGRDPSRILGFGTWERIQYRFLWGGGDESELGLTGGSQTHHHTLSNLGGVPFGLDSDESQVIRNGPNSGTSNYTNRQTGVTWAGSGTSGLINTSLGLVGRTDTGDGMPPYVLVWIYKRVA